jgi:2-succinyl-5-enolpyruvyl-6-hydroxy-3-cyclohexene-1-carboxylate synthase
VVNPSTAQATVLVDELVRSGVRHVVACPGSRNAPLAFALHAADEAGRLRLHVRIDERSAGFLALGLAAGTHRPVALTCTSGTAAANFHPAVAEADRAAVGLIVLTADRPPELRAAGANQVIDQYRLYGGALRHFEELATAEQRTGQNGYWRAAVCRAWQAAQDGPVQLNVPFREPLVPDGTTDWPESLAGRADGTPWSLAAGAPPRRQVLPDAERGLVLLAPGSGHDPAAVADWAQRCGWPMISETGGAGVGGPTTLAGGPWLLGVAEFVAAHRPQQVLCVGRPTVFRQVQQLLSDAHVDVLLVEQPIPANPGHNRRVTGGELGEPLTKGDPDWLADWQRADAAATEALHAVLADAHWRSGMNVAAEVLDALPSGAALTVGSSNPTRDIALAAHSRPDILVHRNRGVSGIDGTVSTAAGVTIGSGRRGYALLGDLTFLHDVNGLLIGADEDRPELTIVVLNDDGGGIFSLLEQAAPEHSASFQRLFGTPHGARIGSLCAGYGVPHTLARSRAELRESLRQPGGGLRVVEVQTTRDDLAGLHERARAAVTEAVRVH